MARTTRSESLRQKPIGRSPIAFRVESDELAERRSPAPGPRTLGVPRICSVASSESFGIRSASTQVGGDDTFGTGRKQ